MEIICPFRCRSIYVLNYDNDDDETLLMCRLTS